MIDAIQVPCSPQCGLLDGGRSPVRSGPVVTELVRSLTFGFTPLSMTATVTPSPEAFIHAAGTSSMLSTHCWLSLIWSAGAADAAGAARNGSAAAAPATQEASASREPRRAS